MNSILNLTPVFAASDIPWIPIIFAGGALIVVIFVFGRIWASRYTKVGPNQVLVISGRKHRMVDPDGTQREIGFRVVKGGGVFVWPVFEKVDIVSL
ncbi:MAG TPA: flotillin family protein, partial [Verrucomicrobiota bacterium]|nr:flotillin family protein [Verrucomicrobiota bacterium]